MKPSTADTGTAGWMARAACGLHLAILALLLLLNGCAGRSPDRAGDRPSLVVTGSGTAVAPLPAMAPAFLLRETHRPHNRIGRVRAAGTSGAETIGIDSERAALYAAARSFTTVRGSYTNLVYRIHFAEQPFSLVPFHFGAGKHVGLLVILTLDAQQRVLLVTTANTCGCYAVSVPTASLPAASYPDDWPTAPLAVYGERLPARLPAISAGDRLVVAVRPEVQRVMDLQVVPHESLAPAEAHVAELLELESLKRLPLEDGTVTSWYYRDWPLAGHVKGAIKPWETLLLSLVSFDLFVGMDKDYGETSESGNPFYTSLKPWNRSASDMNDFAAYLRFNGWRL